MKIRHNDLSINKDDPFENCKLDRKQYALILTDVVNTYSDGFVLAINNEWGTGKTTFVKMWLQHLKNKNFNTVYFNAWENDFDSNPLIALMSELKTLINSNNGTAFKSMLQKGAVLAKNTLPAITKSLLKKYVVDIEEIAIDAVENTVKATTEIFEEEIKDYVAKKKTILEFRSELENFVTKTDNAKPVIFVIDELDRCRPTYAVEVLEQIKHFFSVPGIVFVLSIDKDHLANAVKGFYGNNNINTDEYLRRFIDLEYTIPEPNNATFCRYLFDYFSFKDFFNTSERKRYSEFQYDVESLLKTAEMLFDYTKATLRQQEKIFAQTRLVINFFQQNQYSFSALLFILIFLKVMKADIYRKIEKNIFSLQELSDMFSELMPRDKKDMHGLNLVYVEALLLHFYNNSQEYPSQVRLIDGNQDGALTTPIVSKLEARTGRVSLANSFKTIDEQWNYRETKLDYLLKKISLTSSMYT